MKKIIIVAMSLFAFSAFACPDLSGEYVSNANNYTGKISQQGCSFVTFDFIGSSSNHQVDGVERLIMEFDIFNEHVKIFEKAEFKNSKLVIEHRQETTWSPDSAPSISKETIEYFLDANNNLVTVLFSMGQQHRFEHTRVK